MCNDRVEFVASGYCVLQFDVLLFNESLCCYQGNLVIDTNDELFFVKRLGDEVICATLESLYDISSAIQGSEEDDRYLCGISTLFQLLSYLKTAQVRHHYVK